MKNLDEIIVFEKVQTQLFGLYQEMALLSKKKPDEPVNLFKLKFVNQIISKLNSILDVANKPFDDFEIFDEDNLPTNSDVVFILSQYINCLEKFRSENITYERGTWYWKINNKVSEKETTFPKKASY